MILFGTKLACGDNTDIKKVRCIKILGHSIKKKATLGDIIRATIVKRRYVKEVIKKSIYYNLIVNVKNKCRRKNGIYLRVDRNRSLTLSEQFKFLGTRVYGPICKEIRNTKQKKLQYKKIISYSKGTI